eukprot:4274688-Prymnesium_polylepis.1
MPICKLLRRHDSSAPSVGKVYHGWFEVGESIKESDASYAKEAESKHEARWAYSHAAIFAAAYVCDPEFISHAQSSNSEVQEGLLETMEKIAILLKVRSLAEKDDNIAKLWKLRKKAIETDPMAQKKWDNFPKYPDASDPEVQDFCTKVSAQLVHYRNKQGIFARPFVMNAAKDMPAYL